MGKSKLQSVTALMQHRSLDHWILVPHPIPALENKPAEFEAAVEAARVELVHAQWSTVGEAVRELSDAGGVEYVAVYRVKMRTTEHARWVDGKQVRS